MTTVDVAHPRRARQARTRHIRQVEEAGCGTACLSIVLSRHGRHVPWNELQRVCGGGRDGLTAATLVRVGGHYGLRGAGKRIRLSGKADADITALRQLPVPAILFVGGNHFLVLEHVSPRGRVSVNDPATGRRRMDLAEFRDTFSGIALTFHRTERFTPGGTPERLRDDLLAWARPRTRALSAAAFAGTIAALLGVVTALLMRTTVATLARPGASDLTVLFACLAGTALGVFFATWAQQRLQSRLLMTIALDQSKYLVHTLLHLPAAFFHRRFVGGVAARAQTADTIANQLTGVLIPAVSSTVTLLVVGAVLIWLAPVQAGLAVLGAALSAALIRIAAARDESRQAQLMGEQATRDGEVMSGLSMIETLKAEGSMARLFDRWAESHGLSMSVAHRSVLSNQRFLGVSGALDSIVSVLVIGSGVLAAVRGMLPIADLAAVVTLIGVFQTSAARLARSWLDVGQLRSGFATFSDVEGSASEELLRESMQRATQGTDTPRRTQPDDAGGPPRGQLELRDVTFGYDTNKPPTLRNVTARLAPGQRLAVVGPTGSGKSTIVKLVIGAADAWDGGITLDGRPFDTLPRGAVGYVSQHPVFFDGTVADNLTFGDETVNAEAIRTALADACLDHVVAQRGGPFTATVDQNGQNFSGGERQRLALARALCRRPRLLVLDEATSALEGPLETRVDEQIRRRGVTTVVVAHRLNTVCDDDLVMLLQDGAVAQFGTHAHLSGVEGPYRTLLETPS